MSNQYWKNKIQLKEAYERGQQDNLTEGPLRGLSQIAQTITDPKIAKRLRNLLRNVWDRLPMLRHLVVLQ